MSTRDLINAIAAGDAIEIENAFNSVMAEKVSMRIDDMRVGVAQNLFAEQVEEIEEEVECISEEEYLALSEEEQSMYIAETNFKDKARAAAEKVFKKVAPKTYKKVWDANEKKKKEIAAEIDRLHA